MRTVLAGAAAAWFIWLAATFEAPFGYYVNDGQAGGLDGDAGAIAVRSAVRMLSVGLALASLALLNWEYLYDEFRGRHEPASPVATATDEG